MEFIQQRWKAIAAFLGNLATNLWVFYQSHQNVTLRDVLMSLLQSIVVGGIVHRVTNKGQ